MAGHLHIFRRNVVNASPFFQVNYTVDDFTYARVVDDETMLRDLLINGMGIAPSVMDDIWHQLQSGSATIGGIDLKEHEASALGMTKAPTDI